MLIDTIRRTGKPVKIKDKDEFAQEWTRLYDIAEKVTKVRDPLSGKRLEAQDMLGFQKRLNKIEQALEKRYPTVVKNILPSTAEEWKSLMQEYGDLPLLLTIAKDDNRLVIVIDDLYEQYT